jgi:hypothetical protein
MRVSAACFRSTFAGWNADTICLMSRALLIGAIALNTALLLAGLSYWQMLALDAAVVGCWLICITIRNRAPAMFAARVWGALFDLGLDAKRLGMPLGKKLESEIHATFVATKGRYSHHRLALRFFVYALVETHDAPFHATVREGALTQSVVLIRKWSKEGKVPADVADREIERIKGFLVDSLPLLNASEAERIAMEIQILEL